MHLQTQYTDISPDSFFPESPGSHDCTQTATEFIGTDGAVYGNTRYHIGGDGNQAAASGDGIDKTGKKNQRADNKIGKQAFHGKTGS